MDPIYCPACKKQIPADADLCPECGELTNPIERREAQKKKAEYLAAQEHRFRLEQEQAQRGEAEKKRAQDEEARRKAIYETATGRGVCPSCKSPNVREYTFTEGQNNAGAGMSCCLGCFLTPWAFLALPFMSGRKAKGMECQYCSHRWRL